MHLCALLPPDHLRKPFFALQTQLFAQFGLATARLLPPLVPVAWIAEPLTRTALLAIKQRLTPPRLRIDACVWQSDILVARITPCEWLHELETTLDICTLDQGIGDAALGRLLVPKLCGFYVAWLPESGTSERTMLQKRAEIAHWIAQYDARPQGELHAYRLASLHIETLRACAATGIEAPHRLLEGDMTLRVGTTGAVWLKGL